VYTILVVAVMILMGRVKMSASPDAKMSAHHGICTCSFMNIHNESAIRNETKSVT
jgi:hypothetical protein